MAWRRPGDKPLSEPMMVYRRIDASPRLNELIHMVGIHLILHAVIHRRFSTTWGRHQMEAFSALLALCEGNSPVTGEFLSQRPATRSFDSLFNLGLNKRLSKQSRRWWFETPSCSLWRHCNDQLCRAFMVDIGGHTTVYDNKIYHVYIQHHATDKLMIQ